MYREQLQEDLERARERELLRDLFSTDAAVREHAADELIDANLFVPAQRVVVFALRPVVVDGATGQSPQTAVDLALMQVRRHLMVHNALHIGLHDRGVLLAAVPQHRDEREWLTDIGERLRSALTDSLPSEPETWRSVVGIGDTVDSLTEAAVSQRQAYQAAQVAEVLKTDDVMAWHDLGIYRTLIRCRRRSSPSRRCIPAW